MKVDEGLGGGFSHLREAVDQGFTDRGDEGIREDYDLEYEDVMELLCTLTSLDMITWNRELYGVYCT